MNFNSNPLYRDQWHFDLLGGIEKIWADYSGKDVDVAVYDDGTQRTHPDLIGNYDDTLAYDRLVSDDGQPILSDDGHGTAVGGIIAASNNTIGGIGVAWGANLVGVNFLENLQYRSSTIYFDAFRGMGDYDIVNNSWGQLATYDAQLDLFDLSSDVYAELQGMIDAVAQGRDGLGTVIVKSAGNDNNDVDLERDGLFGNAQGEGLSSAHTLIVVAATDAAGDVEDYSNWGTNLLISAGSASVTTDRTGANGYDTRFGSFGDYTDTFGGTSSAAPVVSGVAALMLEANPGLGWRDVQNIIALSAAQTGSSFGSAGRMFEEGDWYANDATNWNGGGLTYHNSYGFGLLDAYSAVRMAEVWDRLFEDPATSANQIIETVSYTGPTIGIGDGIPQNISISVTREMVVEHIYVTIDMRDSYAGDLSLELVSPDGTVFKLFDNEGGSTAVEDDFTFGVRGAFGIDPRGLWNIRISDGNDADVATFIDATLDFYGSAATTDTVHHFTQDYFDSLRTAEPARGTISDLDGGEDWLNLVALQEDVTVSLEDGAGQVSMANTAQTAQLAGPSDFENVALGDGNDVVLGNGADNAFLGGRGRDLLGGGGGRDRLEGGAGNDILAADGASAATDYYSQQVFRLYQATLDRAPDPLGLKGWTEALGQGADLRDIADAFILSAEFETTYGATSNEQFVTLLYNNVLDRDPDMAGLAGWISAIEIDGMTRADVVLGFSESLEFELITAAESANYSRSLGQSSSGDDVFRLYQATLDREPDAAGFNGWLDILSNGGSYLGAVQGFIESVEFSSIYGSTTNTEFVTLLYDNVLERAADSAGLAAWLDLLDTEQLSRAEVVAGFAQSAEFIDNSAPAYSAYITGFGVDDTIIGGAGNDILIGGGGVDVFVFDVDDGGVDQILGFETWDQIELYGFGYSNASDFINNTNPAGMDLVFRDQGVEIRFDNISLSDLNTDNFSFFA